MAIHDDLGTRMKTFYEQIPKTKLMRRCPVAIRIDGKAFHTFTRGFKKPFDEILIKSMQETTKYLCNSIQGCVFGYTQSDEITLILTDYKTFNTSAWFDYEVQKMCSIAASMATMKFNQVFKKYADETIMNYNFSMVPQCAEMQEEEEKYFTALRNAIEKGAMFDARCFNIPKEEVTNLIYWRQLDASRNSVEMVGRAYFSHNELMNKSCSNIQDMLIEKYHVNWNGYPTIVKRGSACLKGPNGWYIDTEMPILRGEDRSYVDKLIYIGD